MLATRNSESLRKLAFTNQYNVIFLVGAAAFSLALMSPWPALLGAAAELFWLIVGPSSPAFARWAQQREQADQISQRALEEATAVRKLEPPYAARARALQDKASDIRRLGHERGIDPAFFSAGPLSGGPDRLDQLLSSFIKMAALHQRLSQFVAGSGSAHLEEEIVRLGQALAEERDAAVKLSLRQALNLAQRRLTQHEQIDSQRRALGVKMDTLEMSFDYLRSHIFGGTPPQDLAMEMQELVAGANFLTAAEAEANASLARFGSGGATVTRTMSVG